MVDTRVNHNYLSVPVPAVLVTQCRCIVPAHYYVSRSVIYSVGANQSPPVAHPYGKETFAVKAVPQVEHIRLTLG